jgi:DTW domain-containing protein YfiP
MILHHSPTTPTLPKISLAPERLTRWLRESPEEKVHTHSH